MAVIGTEDNTLYIRQGDTGQVEFTGLPTDKTYTAYLAVFNEDTNKIVAKTDGVTVTNGTVVIYFNQGFSDGLPVGEWVWALKICADVPILGTSEDTVIPRSYVDESGTLVTEAAPVFIVDNKLVEGAENTPDDTESAAEDTD